VQQNGNIGIAIGSEVAPGPATEKNCAGNVIASRHYLQEGARRSFCFRIHGPLVIQASGFSL
jgi:hypothetical protein